MSHLFSEEVLATFEEETTERLAEIESGLLALERTPNAIDGELVHSIFRSAHSIKAGANLLKFKDIEALSHRAENILQLVRNEEIQPSPELITTLLEAFDAVRDLMDHLGSTYQPDVRDRIKNLDRYL